MFITTLMARQEWVNQRSHCRGCAMVEAQLLLTLALANLDGKSQGSWRGIYLSRTTHIYLESVIQQSKL